MLTNPVLLLLIKHHILIFRIRKENKSNLISRARKMMYSFLLRYLPLSSLQWWAGTCINDILWSVRKSIILLLDSPVPFMLSKPVRYFRLRTFFLHSIQIQPDFSLEKRKHVENVCVCDSTHPLNALTIHIRIPHICTCTTCIRFSFFL